MRDMFRFLMNLKGNARSVVFTEAMWTVPFNLYSPFFTIYMFQLGVLDMQIGLLLTVGRLFQMVFALLGGVITDKLGRRLTTLIADVVSWSIPVFIWALSQNFWWFLVAALINSTFQISATSWECLWIDDNAEDASWLEKTYNWIYISGQLAVFFAPITGFFINQHSVVPVMRVLLFISFISMTAKFIILFVYSEETDRGVLRMKETKNTPLTQLLIGYKDVFFQILKSWKMKRALIIQAIAGVYFMVSSTFFALYATQNLNTPEHYIAILPILRAGIMLAFFFFIQFRLNSFNQKNIMITGITAFVIANGLLIISPPENIVFLSVYTIIESCAFALLLPRIDTLVANVIEPTERARIRAFFNASILAFTGVFGFVAGFLSSINRQFPFVLNIVLFTVMFIVTLLNPKEVSKQ